LSRADDSYLKRRNYAEQRIKFWAFSGTQGKCRMILEIVKYGDRVLRQKGGAVREITDELCALARDMIETMRAAYGAGLAAQQVGIALQLAVIEVKQERDCPSTMTVDGREVDLADWMPMVLLNPELELGREKEGGTEGCLSFPDVTAEIERAVLVRAKGQLLDGREIEFKATGLLARALQHEVDHLNGVLFIDRMNSASKTALKGKLKRMQREANV
jgi:peptide deformylase